jgi:hypothetical protein
MFCISCLQLYLNSCYSVLFLRSKSCSVFCFLLYHILYFVLASIYLWLCFSILFASDSSFVFCTPESYTIFCVSCLQMSKTCVSQQYLLLFLHPWPYTMCHMSCLQSLNLACFICKLLLSTNNMACTIKIEFQNLQLMTKTGSSQQWTCHEVIWKWVEDLLL